MIQPFFWSQYSSKLNRHIQNPRSMGSFSQEDATACELRLASGSAGAVEDGNWLKYDMLVDPTDGTVIDAKYQVYGESILIGLAEATTHLIIGKNYDQAARMHVEVIDHYLRDKNETPAFGEGGLLYVSLVIEALKSCARLCMDIPISQSYQAPPVMADAVEGEGYPGFDQLTLSQKIAVIDQVLDQEVRPYVEMDAGGVEVIGLQKDQVTIAYQGTCTTCFSATGATLSFIQKVIQAKVDPKLNVVPNL